MRNKIKISKRVFLFLAFGLLVSCVYIGSAGLTVRAGEQADMQTGMQTFIIDAQMLPSGQSVYEIQLKVENTGPDWEGTVRLMIVEDYYGRTNDCAYDTELSLPKGSAKQFVVRVPKDSLDRTDGVVQVTLLDKEAGMTAQKEFGRLLQTEADALTMGILSDEYMSLTYLDMGGSEFYYNGRAYPIRLEELDQDRLAESVSGLNFLVIDSYNTDVLSEEALENVRLWIDQGGVLILGTGNRADEVLAGFDDLEIQCTKVNAPGEDESDFSDYVDVSLLSMAELVDGNNNYDPGYDIFGLIGSRGDGAVGVLPYSLSEAAKANALGDYDQQKGFVESMVRRVSNYSNSGYGSSQYASKYDSMFLLQRICIQLGNGSNRLRFGGLKLIVVLYVIFVGPVLYLILRLVGKRDFYWIAVPITTLVGVLLIYWTGRGFEVVGTNVYSVTVENLTDGGEAQTYLRCYDAGHKEWTLRLAEGYEYAGPLEDGYYQSDGDSYYYRIRREGDRLFFGMNPAVGFEDGYFQAGIIREPEKGGIFGDLQKDGSKGISGIVRNETKRDFKYFAVSMGDDVFVYQNLPAGAELKLEEAEIIYDGDDGYYDGIMGYCYSFLHQVQAGEMEQDVDALTALGLGLSCAYLTEDSNATVIAGVTEDWDKTVDDHCSESSYGCLYAVQ